MSRHSNIMELAAKRYAYGYWTCGWDPHKRDRQRRKPIVGGSTVDVRGCNEVHARLMKRLGKQ